MNEKISTFESMEDTSLFEVGNVSEESFLSDIHSAVENGEGKPPKVEPEEIKAEEPIGNTGQSQQNTPPMDGGQSEPFFTGGQSQKISVDNLISADIAFSLIDKFLPIALVFALDKLSVKATASELRASEKEKRTITPVLDRAMREVNLNFDNPFVALGVVLFAVYGSKGLEIYMTREKMPKAERNSYTSVSEGKKGRGRPRKI